MLKVEEIGLDKVVIMPPRPGVCPVCAAEHSEIEPHNAGSLYYQMKFRQRNGVFPNWGDAMRHCPKDVQEAWKSRLLEHGVAEEDLVAHRFYPESLDMEITAEGKVTPEQREQLLRRPERPGEDETRAVDMETEK